MPNPLVCTFAAAVHFVAASVPIVSTSCGDIVGSEVDDGRGAVWRFAGIKFAEAQRWKLPAAYCRGDASTFHANDYGPMCPQANSVPVPRLLLAIWAGTSLAWLFAIVWSSSRRAREVGSSCLRRARDCLDPERYERLREQFQRLKDAADDSASVPGRGGRACCCACTSCTPPVRTCCAATASVMSLLLSLLAAGSTESSAVIGSEDCLHLNVWRPALAHLAAASTDGGLRPVFAFIHGGNLNFGSGRAAGDPVAWVSLPTIIVPHRPP